MRGITSLPVEILVQIFQDVATPNEEFESTSDTNCSRRRTSFPFNAAYTCFFWLEILKANPQIWKSVAIDVAEDPTPFLDTLGLFENGPIDVTIFSSFRNTDTLPSGSEINEDTHKHCENTRAQAVFSSLEPLIARCESIVFDLIYLSSLPSAAKILIADPPNLRDLSLKCQIYDLDDDKSDIEFEKPRSQPNIWLPCLNGISVTGYAFMEFYDTVLPKALQECYVNLAINHLKLHGQDTGSSTRSFAKFMGALEDIKCQRLFLSDASLDHPPVSRTGEGYDLAVDYFTFDCVSPTFISALISNINFDEEDTVSLSFTKCSVPYIGRPLPGETMFFRVNFSSVDFIDSIPYQECGTPDNSLVDLAIVFDPVCLRLVGCDGVTDDFFTQLSRGGSEQRLVMLIINNCTRFTPGALIGYLKARQRMIHPLNTVQVLGKGPKISTEEAAWFTNLSPRYVWEARCDVDDVNER